MAVHQNPKTKKWGFRCYPYDPIEKTKTGKAKKGKKQIHREGFATKAEAKAMEAEAIKQSLTQQTSGMLFSNLVDLFCRDRKARNSVTTQESYNNSFRVHILPVFATRIISTITPLDVRQWQNGLIASGLKRSTINKVNTHLSAVFSYACRYCHLSKNPVALAGPIRMPVEASDNDDNRAKFWTSTQFNDFMSHITDETDRTIYLIAFWTGLREGEIMGLRIRDIDIKNKRLKVEQIRIRAKGGEIRKPPKTSNSRRVVELDDRLVADLAKYIDRMHFNPDPDDDLFPVRASRTSKFLQYQKKYGIEPKLKFHGLRHSHASLLINQGFSAKAVADRLGNSETMVIKIYGHLYQSSRQAIVNKINSLRG